MRKYPYTPLEDVDSVLIEADETGRQPEGGLAVNDPEKFKAKWGEAASFIESPEGKKFFELVDEALPALMHGYLQQAIPDADKE